MRLVVLVLIVALGGASCTSELSGPVDEATVVAIVDGDTLILDLAGGEDTVRLIGIDTPETKAPNTPIECFGPEATAQLEALLPIGTVVRVRRDTEPRDRFDRRLLYVFRKEDELFVNLVLVADGFATTLSIAPNETYAAEFSAAEARARSAGLGLWTTCPDAGR